MADPRSSSRATSRTITREQILAQIPDARRRAKAARARGIRAEAACYDAASERIVVELTNGVALAIPIAFVPGLVDATPRERTRIELTPSGSGIRWPALDTDISIPGVIEHLMGRTAVAQTLGRRGGQAKTAAKARAARANGARGGRPRKNAAATHS